MLMFSRNWTPISSCLYIRLKNVTKKKSWAGDFIIFSLKSGKCWIPPPKQGKWLFRVCIIVGTPPLLKGGGVERSPKWLKGGVTEWQIKRGG